MAFFLKVGRRGVQKLIVKLFVISVLQGDGVLQETTILGAA